MSKYHSFLDTVDQIVTDGVKRGILHLNNEDEKLSGNSLHLKGKEVINFGSCSYLGLEFNPRLIEGACQAIQNFGTQFSESRAYVSLSLYKTLENKFEEIFGSPVIVTPTTSLAHIACIPVLVNENDAVLMDHQVHSSVQNAVSIVKSKGVYTELIRHNRMDLLEERIIELRKKHKNIWYMADGIYSMYGDACPIEKIIELLDKYEEFHFYVDDAHGMSSFGKNGRGYVLDKVKIHKRMIVATSLAKAFATGGAVLVFPDKETARRVRTCGGPLITSGPLQPGTLGAAIASANIHLSDEITVFQNELQEKIKYAQIMLRKHDLPVISGANSPVFFIAVSLPKIGYKLIEKMIQSGFYLNLGIFPAVPMKNTGIRFTITRLHSFSQIDSMIAALSRHFNEIITENNFSLDDIYKAFKIQPHSENPLKTDAIKPITEELTKEIYSSINEIKRSEWDSVMSEKGSFDYSGMQYLEKTFKENILPEDNWEFRYLIVRDKNDKIVLATFFTACLWKEDMLSPNEISVIIEQKRMMEPYLLTSTVLMTGSLLTEGQHLFIDHESPLWKKGMQIFFSTVTELQEKFEVSNTLIRDFETGNNELDSLFIEEGFFRLNMPDNHRIQSAGTFTMESFLEKLSPRSRKHFRQDILKHEEKFIFSIENTPEKNQIEQWYELYLNVKKRSLDLNTFTLPFKTFSEMAKNDNWQISILKLKPEYDSREEQLPVAVMFTFISGNSANFMLIGIDYDFQKEFHCYRQGLYQVIKYNLRNGIKNIHLGFAASFEKRKLGAEIIPTCAYMQMRDNYSMQYINELKGNETVMNIVKQY